MGVIIKQPVRKTFGMGTRRSVYVTIPPELGIKPGDEVFFRIESGKIILEKIERREGT